MLINPVGALINYSYFPYHATVATWLFPFTDRLGEDVIQPLHSVDSTECTVWLSRNKVKVCVYDLCFPCQEQRRVSRARIGETTPIFRAAGGSVPVRAPSQRVWTERSYHATAGMFRHIFIHKFYTIRR